MLHISPAVLAYEAGLTTSRILQIIKEGKIKADNIGSERSPRYIIDTEKNKEIIEKLKR